MMVVVEREGAVYARIRLYGPGHGSTTGRCMSLPPANATPGQRLLTNQIIALAEELYFISKSGLKGSPGIDFKYLAPLESSATKVQRHFGDVMQAYIPQSQHHLSPPAHSTPPHLARTPCRKPSHLTGATMGSAMPSSADWLC